MTYKDLFAELAVDMSLCPRPFAGEYPTRIKFHSTDRYHPFEYYGKPSADIMARVLKALAVGRPGTHRLNVTEIDQNGIVISLIGGMVNPCGFYSIYFPVPTVVWDLDRNGRYYALLSRKHVKIGEKYMWVIPDLMGEKPVEGYAQMVMNCSRNKVGRDVLTRAECAEVLKRLTEKSDKWINEEKPPQAPTKKIDYVQAAKILRGMKRPDVGVRIPVEPAPPAEPKQIFANPGQVFQVMANQMVEQGLQNYANQLVYGNPPPKAPDWVAPAWHRLDEPIFEDLEGI